MTNKKVLCYQVAIPEGINFAQVLMDPTFQRPARVNQKDVEINFAAHHAANDTITGIFVCTQKTGLPPTHIPGKEDEYSAVPLKEEEGLAYPNTFLYCIKSKVLFMEQNRLGATPNVLFEFFGKNAILAGIPDWYLELLPVMSQSAYQKLEDMILISEIEFQTANPQAVILEKAKDKNNPIFGFAKVAAECGADRSMSIRLTSEKKKNSSFKKKEVADMMEYYSGESSGNYGKVRPKLRIKGYRTVDEQEVQECIDLITDRLMGFFKLAQSKVTSDLQVHERRSGIIEVYTRLFPDLRRILKF